MALAFGRSSDSVRLIHLYSNLKFRHFERWASSWPEMVAIWPFLARIMELARTGHDHETARRGRPGRSVRWDGNLLNSATPDRPIKPAIPALPGPRARAARPARSGRRRQTAPGRPGPRRRPGWR